MGYARSGISIVEAIMGLAIAGLVVAAGVQPLRSLSQSYKRANVVNSLQKIETLVRNGIFLQKNYVDLSQIEIKLGNVLLAKHNSPVYIKEDLTESSLTANTFPIKVQLMMSQFNFAGQPRLGAVYQISYGDDNLKLRPVGLQQFPTSEAALKNQLEVSYDPTLANPESSQLLVVPKKFSQANEQDCGNGFLRGISSDASRALCWSFSQQECPAWSVPVGFVLNSDTNVVSVKCQKLNRITCPPLQLSMNGGASASLQNFLMYSELNLSDLFPPRASTSVGQSLCKPVVDFKRFSTDGRISSTQVSERSPASLGAVCPDSTLYTPQPDGSCLPNFDVNSIGSSQAVVTPAVVGDSP